MYIYFRGEITMSSSLLQRKMIRRMIKESINNNLIRKQNKNRKMALKSFERRHAQMIREGYSISEANQLILEIDFLKALGLGSFSGLKQQIVTSALKDLGVPTNTLSGKFLVNVIENIGVKQLMALFGAGEGGCDAVVELLSKAAMETITEYGAAKLIAYVFEKTAGKTSTVASYEIEQVMDTFIGSVGVEIINDMIYQYFKVAMLDELADKICNDGIMSFISSTDDASLSTLARRTTGGDSSLLRTAIDAADEIELPEYI